MQRHGSASADIGWKGDGWGRVLREGSARERVQVKGTDAGMGVAQSRRPPDVGPALGALKASSILGPGAEPKQWVRELPAAGKLPHSGTPLPSVGEWSGGGAVELLLRSDKTL